MVWSANVGDGLMLFQYTFGQKASMNSKNEYATEVKNCRDGSFGVLPKNASCVRNNKATLGWLNHFAENLPLCVNLVSGYYQEIAGAQEGTRTPTELPAST